MIFHRHSARLFNSNSCHATLWNGNGISSEFRLTQENNWRHGMLPVNMSIIWSSSPQNITTKTTTTVWKYQQFFFFLNAHSKRLGWVFLQQIVGSQSNVRDDREKGSVQKLALQQHKRLLPMDVDLREFLTGRPTCTRAQTGSRAFTVKGEMWSVSSLRWGLEICFCQEVLSGGWEAAVCASVQWKALFSATAGHISLWTLPTWRTLRFSIFTSCRH